MAKWYVLLEIEVSDVQDADNVAEGISDSVQAPIKGVFPSADFEKDKDGQLVIYTGQYAS